MRLLFVSDQSQTKSEFITSCKSLLIHIPIYIFQEKFAGVDIRVRVSGGGHVAQIYAIRQAISKALVAFYQKCKCDLKTNAHVLLGPKVNTRI